MGKQINETVAAIDLGSNSIRMMIAQITENGQILPLEDLHRKTNIGRDTFAYGKVLPESINETCDLLKGFTQLMKEYSTKKYRAVTTAE